MKSLLILALIALPLLSHAATFGYPIIGSNQTSQNSDFFRATKGIPLQNGLVNSVSVYCDTGGNTRNWIARIYTALDANLSPDSAVGTCTASAGWATSTFPSGILVNVGVPYYIGVTFDSGPLTSRADVYLDNGGSSDQSMARNGISYPTLPTASNSYDTNYYSMYATYDPAPYTVALTNSTITLTSGTMIIR